MCLWHDSHHPYDTWPQRRGYSENHSRYKIMRYCSLNEFQCDDKYCCLPKPTWHQDQKSEMPVYHLSDTNGAGKPSNHTWCVLFYESPRMSEKNKFNKKPDGQLISPLAQSNMRGRFSASPYYSEVQSHKLTIPISKWRWNSNVQSGVAVAVSVWHG